MCYTISLHPCNSWDHIVINATISVHDTKYVEVRQKIVRLDNEDFHSDIVIIDVTIPMCGQGASEARTCCMCNPMCNHACGCGSAIISCAQDGRQCTIAQSHIFFPFIYLFNFFPNVFYSGVDIPRQQVYHGDRHTSLQTYGWSGKCIVSLAYQVGAADWGVGAGQEGL